MTVSLNELWIIKVKKKPDENLTCEERKKTDTYSVVGVSIEDVREVVLAVFFKAEVLDSELDILPLLHSQPALRGLQGKLLNG